MAKIMAPSLVPKRAELKLHHPTDDTITEFDLPDGRKVEGILHIVSRNSKEFLDFMRMASMKYGTEKIATLNRWTEEFHCMIASLVVGWEDNGFIDTPYSPEAAQELITAPENQWLRDQIMMFMSDETRFFTNGPTASENTSNTSPETSSQTQKQDEATEKSG